MYKLVLRLIGDDIPIHGIGLEILMSFVTMELDFKLHTQRNPPADFYYDGYAFPDIQNYICPKDFNSISKGREILSLQHLSRCTIRSEIFKKLSHENRMYLLDLVEPLEIPVNLKMYLCFLDNVPLEN